MRNLTFTSLDVVSCRRMKALWLVVVVACKSEQAPPPPPPPAPPVHPVDAASALAPAREQFWARLVDANGAPGPEMLAYCRDAKAAENVDVAPGVAMERADVGTCQLLVQAPAPIDEAREVLKRWGSTSLLDERDRLDARVVDNQSSITTSWATYVPLEQIIGTGGRVLAGFDATRVVGKSPLAMRDAVSAPLVLEADCTADGCSAVGARPPGGNPVRVGMLKNTPSISLKLETTRASMPKLYELLDASLGEHDGHHVYRRDGVRYEVKERPDRPVVDIAITKDQ